MAEVEGLDVFNSTYIAPYPRNPQPPILKRITKALENNLHIISGFGQRIDKIKLMEVLVEKVKVYEKLEKPKLSVTYGDAIHEFIKCRDPFDPTLSKSFEEKLVCEVDEGIDFLEVGLWDSHRVTSDKLVGSAKVQLDNVNSENFHHFTKPLLSNNGRLVGEIRLKIRRLAEANMQHSIMPLLPSVGLTRPSVLPDGLPVLRGTEIPSARIRTNIGDLYEFNLEGYDAPLKEFDTYISMKYGDVVYKTEKSTDKFFCKANEAIKVLDVHLWKRHRFSPDELVGSAKIELDCVTSGAFRHITTQLISKDGRDVGEVGLKVRLVKPNDVNHPWKSYKIDNFHNCIKQ